MVDGLICPILHSILFPFKRKKILGSALDSPCGIQKGVFGYKDDDVK